MTTALLVMVHGSPRPVANEDMYAVVGLVCESGAYPIVEVGFMDCNLPTIPQAIETCMARGARRIVGVPYFLHVGNHVLNDLPALLEAAQVRHPSVEFLMADPLGDDPLVLDVIRDRAGSSRVVE